LITPTVDPLCSLPPEILDRLRCPERGLPTVVEGGGVVCPAGHHIRCRSGYLDALHSPADPATQRTFRSFGDEWTRFEPIPVQDEVSWSEYFADVPPEDLRGRDPEEGVVARRSADREVPCTSSV
jgi:hypothetical protein